MNFFFKIRNFVYTTLLIGSCFCMGREETQKQCTLVSYDGFCVVSIYRLVSNPMYFSGKKIAVVGIASIGFESNSIFTDYGSYKQYIIFNSVKLDLTPKQTKKFEWMSGKYLLFKGLFNFPDKRGSAFNGILGDIKEIRRVGVNE